MSAGRRLARTHPILALPLPPLASRFTAQLLPDTLTPFPASLLSTKNSSPSLLRRSRGVGAGAHFTFLTPLPLPFPYDFPEPPVGEGDDDKRGGSGEAAEDAHDIRREMAELMARAQAGELESLTPEQKDEVRLRMVTLRNELVERDMRPLEVAPRDAGVETGGDLRAFLPRARGDAHFPSARLAGVSEAALRDCLPHLDVGDAVEWIRDKSGRQGPESYSSGPIVDAVARRGGGGEVGAGEEEAAARARRQLSDVLAGRMFGAAFPKSVSPEDEPRLGVGNDAEWRAEQRKTQANGGATEAEREGNDERRKRRHEERLERMHDAEGLRSGYAPWAMAYSGHQFGQWAGQLGDGRATTLFETINPISGERWEVQLKGAGRTPYSRFADGLATLASSVREYLGSEAVAALGIPTSRALALVSLPDLSVSRERTNPAGVCTRLAPTWVRVGSFQHHASRGEWESVRLLGEFVCREAMRGGAPAHGADGGGGGGSANGADATAAAAAGGTEGGDEPWARKLLRECAVRNARTFARWQVYGFMHGVLNTDNISVLGLTIDYGPYAFMDRYDARASSNKSDSEGRYVFQMQPSAGLFAIEELAQSLRPLIGFELEHRRAARAGELWSDSAGAKEAVRAWTAKADEAGAVEEAKTAFVEATAVEWRAAWATRLGLRGARPDDREELLDPLLGVLEELDFSATLRRLADVAPALLRADDDVAGAAARVVDAGGWVDLEQAPEFMRDAKRKKATEWLARWGERLRDEARTAEEVQRQLKQHNPRFVLRNWITDEVAQRLERDNDTVFLERVLQMCTHPFEEYGEAREGVTDAAVLEEERRLCAQGRLLETNMPSCSS